MTGAMTNDLVLAPASARDLAGWQMIAQYLDAGSQVYPRVARLQ